MGLLDYITAHSLDEDYAHVAEQQGPAVAEEDRRREPAAARLATCVALGARSGCS